MSPRAFAIVEVFRSALVSIESLAPAEQDQIIGSLVADLRARRPVAVAPLGTLPPPAASIRDPREP